MDSFSTLGLATDCLQFVDLGSRLFSKGRELYKSADGSLTANKELEVITNDLTKVCETLMRPENQSTLMGPSEFEAALMTLIKSCKELGDEFLRLLRNLKVRGRCKKRMTLSEAVRIVCKEKKIRNYEQ